MFRGMRLCCGGKKGKESLERLEKYCGKRKSDGRKTCV